MAIPQLSLTALALALFTAAGWGAVEVKKEAGKVVVKVNGLPFTEYVYQGAPHTYFYPLYGPGGVKVTRAYPMESVAGEDHDHPHHRSLWYAHGLVNGEDFWSEEATYGGKKPKYPLGKIVHDSFLELKGGDQGGVISSLNRWVASDGSVPLTSVQTVRIHETPDTERVLDFEVTLTAAENEVVFGDTKEGTMALRLAETMRLKPNKDKIGDGHMVSSEGVKDGDVWGKRADWVDCYGPVDGKLVGIAIFDHPSNLRHPTRWHARDYGLFAANPFAESQMDPALPKGSGDYKLAAGQKLTFKYRIYIHEGDPAQARVAERYAEYIK